MATAREQLLNALNSILSQAPNESGKGSLRRLLKSYRIQVKPCEQTSKNQTARQYLASILLKMWEEQQKIEKSDIIAVISRFRMQLKATTFKSGVRQFSTSPYESSTKNKTGKEFLNIDDRYAQFENAYFRDEKNNKNEEKKELWPIAGGPRKKNASKGECPKCKSIGIVLAQVYRGEDYYSCIYCGYKEFINENDPKDQLPYAARMLDKVGIDEPDIDE